MFPERSIAFVDGLPLLPPVKIRTARGVGLMRRVFVIFALKMLLSRYLGHASDPSRLAALTLKGDLSKALNRSGQANIQPWSPTAR
jgi:hypothetical protein